MDWNDNRYNNGIFLKNVKNGTISNCRIIWNKYGISISNGKEISILNNDINMNDFGIQIHNSNKMQVYNNKCDLNRYGIYLDTENFHCDIFNNSFSQNSNGGAIVRESDNNNIHDNACNFNRDLNKISVASWFGIKLDDSLFNSVYNNNVSRNSANGIIIRNGGNNDVFNNTLIGMKTYANNLSYFAFNLVRTIYNRIFNNSFKNCGINIEGSEDEHWFSNFIDSTNTVNGKSVLFMKNSTTSSSISEKYGLILLFNSKNKIISDRDFNQIANPISIYYSTDIQVNNCSFDNSSSLIRIFESENVVINKCTFSGFIRSIDMEFCKWINITNNKILNGKSYGLRLNAVSYIRVNTNIITNNSVYGIHITGSWYKGTSSNNNWINNNSFIGNNNGQIQAKDEGENNNWDNNYWSDYQARYVPPATNDGIFWDTPYVVDGGQDNKDNYPLVSRDINFQMFLNISSENQKIASVDGDYSVQYEVVYTGGWWDDIRWSFSSNASWLTFDENNTLKGKPGLSDVGSFWINISVTDGILSDYTNFTLIVKVHNYPPNITTDPVYKIDQWSEYWVDYNATDEKIESLTWSLFTNASFLNIDDYSGILSGIPGLNDVGIFHVNVSVSDGVFIESSLFNLKVIDVNDPPMQNLSTIQVFVYEDNNISFHLSELFYNFDEDPLEVSIQKNSNISTFIDETGTILIAPKKDWFGNETLKFNVSDGYYNLTFEMIVFVMKVNDLPTDLTIRFAYPVLYEGENQVVYASFFDPDPDDVANITWIVDGIGVIGYGQTINLSLDGGRYNLTLRIMDSSGNHTKITVSFIVEKRSDDTANQNDTSFPWELILFLIVIILIILIVGFLFILRYRNNRKSKTLIQDSIVGHEKSMGKYSRQWVGNGSSFTNENPIHGVEQGNLKAGNFVDIPWLGSVDDRIITSLQQILEDEIVFSNDIEMERIERELQNKFRDGVLTEKEYHNITSFLSDLIEE